MNDVYKKRVISQIALILSVLVCIIGIKLIGTLPDELDIEYIEQNFIASVENFTAERAETMMYLASIVLFPVSYLIFNNILVNITCYCNYFGLYKSAIVFYKWENMYKNIFSNTIFSFIICYGKV